MPPTSRLPRLMRPDHEIPQVLPRIALTGAALDELELLAGGLYAPANEYCLPGHVPDDWPVPFQLEIPSPIAAAALAGGTLTITDADGTPVFLVTATATAESGPGLAHIAGHISALRSPEHPPARHLRITSPLSPQAENALVAIFSSTPRAAELAQVITEATQSGRHVLLIAACGPQPHGKYTVVPLLTELRAVAAQLPDAAVGLLVLPSLGGEAAHALYLHVLGNLGAASVLSFHAPRSAAAAPLSEARSEGSTTTDTLSGTVIFLTGLSGSGKSTVARALVENLQTCSSRPITLLDGDDVRRILSPGMGFSQEEREANIRRLGWVASLIAQAGGIVVCAPIAPYDKTRQEVRGMIETVGRFVLVHISTPLDVCEARDRKGLYARARKGELKNFTGVDAPYEVPGDASLQLDTSITPLADAVDQILDYLNRGERSADRAKLSTPACPEALPAR